MIAQEFKEFWCGYCGYFVLFKDQRAFLHHLNDCEIFVSNL